MGVVVTVAAALAAAEEALAFFRLAKRGKSFWESVSGTVVAAAIDEFEVTLALLLLVLLLPLPPLLLLYLCCLWYDDEEERLAE